MSSEGTPIPSDLSSGQAPGRASTLALGCVPAVRESLFGRLRAVDLFFKTFFLSAGRLESVPHKPGPWWDCWEAGGFIKAKGKAS